MKTQTFSSVLDVTTTENKNILATRIGLNATTSIRIILGYAPQETVESETREDFFTDLEIEINNSKLDGDYPIICGDLNAKMEWTDSKITPLSSNGKLLHSLVENQDLLVLNFDERCSGKWTHVIRSMSVRPTEEQNTIQRPQRHNYNTEHTNNQEETIMSNIMENYKRWSQPICRRM